MKSKIILPILILVTAILAGLLLFKNFFPKQTDNAFSSPTLNNIDGIESDFAKRLARAKSYDHQAVMRGIDEASEYRLSGDLFSREGNFDMAAKEYSKAYNVDIGSRAVSGFLLAETYEKLDRYEDAISHLNQMIQNGELSEHGIEDAKQMMARLLAPKNASQQ